MGKVTNKRRRIMESHYRSIVKAITWRAGGTIVTFAVAWILAQKLELAAAQKLELAAQIGLLDTVIKIGAFYAHERIWNRVGFGKVKPPEYEI
jgi:uncharacterized membrane protein